MSASESWPNKDEPIIKPIIGVLGAPWLLIVAVLALWLTLAVHLVITYKTSGRFVYAIDDPYIHMAMAKNLVQHGSWGVNAGEFSSSASSLAWPLLIACGYLVFGVNEWVPLVLNVIFATLLVAGAWWILRRQWPNLPVTYQMTILLGLVFLVPLPVIAISGMEHIFQAVTVVLFIYLAARLLSKESLNLRNRESLALLGVAALVTLARYEGLFVVFAAFVLFLLRRRVKFAFLLTAAATLPLIIFGFISHLAGWPFLPNSITVKSQMPSITTIDGIVNLFGFHAYKQLMENPNVAFLIAIALVVFTLRLVQQKNIWNVGQFMLAMFLATSFLHLEFAQIGWFFRYEVYLVAVGIIVVIPLSFELVTRLLPSGKSDLIKHVAIFIILLVAIIPLAGRAENAFLQLSRATSHTSDKQYELGRFIGEYYQGSVVAADDIGAITYLGNLKVFDLAGLADIDTGEMRRANEVFDPWRLNRIAKARGMKIAAICGHWFLSSIPGNWIKVGDWKIGNNYVGDSKVSFYAINSDEAARLKENLISYAPNMARTNKLELN